GAGGCGGWGRPRGRAGGGGTSSARGETVGGGARHLRGLIERFANDVPLALAAYNAGENAVVTYRGIPPYAETQDYVTRVLRLFYGTTANGTPLPTEPFKKLESDGTVVYTNIPPRPRL